jgi:hypothetical protein
MADNRPQIFRGPDVAIGSNSEVGARNRHVRFAPDSYQTADIAGGPVRATTGLMQRSNESQATCQERTAVAGPWQEVYYAKEWRC